jgi:hypothetical protein
VDNNIFSKAITVGPMGAPIIFSRGATERARFSTTGRFGLGVINPSSTLEINAASGVSPFIAKINGAERARIDSSGRLLVGTSTAAAGTVETTAIVGSALTQSTGVRDVAASGTLDLVITGNGFVGHLYVSHVNKGAAGSRTNRIYFITSRLGNATVITQLNTADGSSAGFAFTITNPSGNTIRLTNTASLPSSSSMTFVGTIGF